MAQNGKVPIQCWSGPTARENTITPLSGEPAFIQDIPEARIGNGSWVSGLPMGRLPFFDEQLNPSQDNGSAGTWTTTSLQATAKTRGTVLTGNRYLTLCRLMVNGEPGTGSRTVPYEFKTRLFNVTQNTPYIFSAGGLFYWPTSWAFDELTEDVVHQGIIAADVDDVIAVQLFGTSPSTTNWAAIALWDNSVFELIEVD